MSQSCPFAQKSNPNVVYVVEKEPTNGLGLAGFIVSLIGLLFTCGLLCPLGLFFSFIALFKRPRGFAVAGFVLGGIGTFFVGTVLLAIVASAHRGQIAQIQQQDAMMREAELAARASILAAQQRIEAERSLHGQLPETDAGNMFMTDVRDVWGGTPQYRKIDEQYYEIRSPGGDRVIGTADDLVVDNLESSDSLKPLILEGPQDSLPPAFDDFAPPAEPSPDLPDTLPPATSRRRSENVKIVISFD